MKHASAQLLHSHADLLTELRAMPKLTEKKLGVYYKKSRAFLHFHEDSGKLYADVRLDDVDFNRLAASTNQEQQHLISRITKALK